MPPRRSTPRGPSAIHAIVTTSGPRGTRAGSIAPSEASTSKRSTRSNAARGFVNSSVNNPQLPEVQTQESFAYGSQKIPVLPERLLARGTMTMSQMAETIDLGVQQAEKHLAAHAAEVQANFAAQATLEASRADRARRRSQSRAESERSSRDGSVDSQDSNNRATRRTAAWASSVSTHLPDIDEDETQGEPRRTPGVEDDHSLPETDAASSFPTGNFDISYNQERGRFRTPSKPDLGSHRSSIVQSTTHLAKRAHNGLNSLLRQTFGYCKRSLSTSVRVCSQLITSVAQASALFPGPRTVATLFISLCAIGFATMASSIILCSLYKRYLCDTNSTSTGHILAQSLCGACDPAFPPLVPHWPTGSEGAPDLSAMTKVLRNLDSRIRKVEAQANEKYTSLSSTLSDLTQHHHDIDVAISTLQRHHQSSNQTPIPPAKINYCSLGTGAVIDPYLTSPTRKRQLSYKFPTILLQPLLTLLTGTQKYQSQPPSEALRAWEDVGDCWCAAPAPGGFAQLTVLMGHTIYPDEVVVEYMRREETPWPGSAPRQVEIWGDFSDLAPRELSDLGPGIDGHDKKTEVQQGLPKGFVKLREVTYELAHDRSVSPAQTFRLDINHDGRRRWRTNKMLFRVKANYGAAWTCLYRVRVHGEPVVPHSGVRLGNE